ncbi:ABC transporter, ATP-binding protein (cluster 1, maltose/g3p/polyamine/iron); ABC transporter, ATP-binding protein (cluster 10, nitrate/sulfonate/bicarbonate) [Olavius sp. associated proteobacterium Delta 1]|nr:ABC transporter, ATP-binding protein (cluster 1, maltose/g3p/polyamine/iron); ABC transporter, ATP-binding protein (cluster 10, nitrate/sulfonate/bicarbonate) [Olavius sp. associated proteobacterium Delta 1]
MAVVKLEGITKVYEGSKESAVKDINFQVDDGEFMVLLGPSGCGKSTILRMIAGLENISGGRLSIDGKMINDIPAKDRDIAMVFQSYALYPHMKVRDNLAFGLRRRGIPKAQIKHRVNQVAESLGLTPFLNRRPHALSGGQRQRVAVGRAIVRDPKVFLFDEPLSNLDASLRVSTRNELVSLHDRLGATTIYVTHDQVEAMTMGSRICIINEGQLVQIGPPMEVYRRPANTFVAGFLGSPPMNLLPANLEPGNAGRSLLGIGSQTINAPPEWDNLLAGRSGEVIFGIRPEDLFLPGQAQSGNAVAELNMEVSGVEALGAETVLIFKVAGLDQTIFVKADRFAEARRGDRIRVKADLSAARLFDPHSKQVIKGKIED